jgi:crotonobetainyl-CoA:carnitine CoA-transferase CaiB-like acyl-CoA transferase
VNAPPKPLPLAGVRVLDFGQFVAIPFCTLWMAWLGAEVIAVESSSRMTARGAPPFAKAKYGDKNASGYFNSLYASKKSIVLDLASKQGRRLALELVKSCDVMVENFATGVIEKLGLGYDVVSGINPRLIMISNGAFGRTGSMKHVRGLHSTVNLFSGVADVTGYPGGAPRILGSVIPDPLSGMYANLAILTALEYRERSGRGQYIDIAMYEAMLSLIPEAVIDFSLHDADPQRMGNRDRQKAPHGIYPTQGHDRWLALSVDGEPMWQSFCSVIGQEGLRRDNRFADAAARLVHVDALDTIVAHWAAAQELEQAVAALQKAGVTAGPVVRSDELLANEQLKARGMVVDVSHPVAGDHQHLGLPWTMDSLGADYRRAPLLGEHTHEVLTKLLGLSQEEYDALEAQNVLS